MENNFMRFIEPSKYPLCFEFSYNSSIFTLFVIRDIKIFYNFLIFLKNIEKSEKEMA
jgi:hypothetical protein